MISRNQISELLPLGNPDGRDIARSERFDPVSAIGAGIGGIGSIVGGVLGSGAAKKAGTTLANNAQVVNALTQGAVNSGQGAVAAGAQAANELVGTGTSQAAQSIGGGIAGANQTLSDIFNQEYGNLSPYLQTGQTGLSMLNAAVQPGGSLSGTFAAPTAAAVQATPGYQFTLDQGSQAIMRNAAASGLSGGTLKGLTQYGQGLAGQYYQQAFNNALTGFNTNRNATMQNIAALLGQGNYGTSQFQNAAQNYGNQAGANIMGGNSQLANYQQNAANLQGANLTNAAQYIGNIGMQGAQLEGNALTQGANATAASQVGAANAWQNAIGGITNAAGYGLAGLYGGNGATTGGPSAPPNWGGMTAAMYPGYSPSQYPPSVGPMQTPYASFPSVLNNAPYAPAPNWATMVSPPPPYNGGGY